MQRPPFKHGSRQCTPKPLRPGPLVPADREPLVRDGVVGEVSGATEQELAVMPPGQRHVLGRTQRPRPHDLRHTGTIQGPRWPPQGFIHPSQHTSAGPRLHTFTRLMP